MHLNYDLDSPEVKYLVQKDPTLLPIFVSGGKLTIKRETDCFEALVSAIVSQQLSGKVAEVIYKRLKDFFQMKITPETILDSDQEELRSLGLSYNKIKYLLSLSTEVISGSVKFENIENLSDAEIIKMLVRIKGIGKWSAEMFLMFSLGRQDVFSSLDLGLRKALEKLYGKPFGVEDAEMLSQNWSPYRSVVAFYLWRYN